MTKTAIQTEIDSEPSLTRLLELYNAHGWQKITRDTIARLDPGDETRERMKAGYERDRAAGEHVSTLDAMRAGERIAKQLTGWRWILMRDARQEGRTWTEIGEALGMTKQGAYDWYRNAIANQERYAPEYHDSAAARSVLGQPDD